MESVTIVGICSILILVYSLIKWKYSYWERKGMPFIKPVIIPYGNFKGVGKHIHTSELLKKFYNEMKGEHKIFGMYSLHNPVAMVTDLELINRILIKDFNVFVNRGVYHNERDDPLSAHLVNIEDQKWRSLRSKLTPTFTSGKMKFMYPTIVKVSNEFKCTIDSMLKETDEKAADIEIKDFLARFTTDIIGECAFGIECNSLKNPDAEFRKMGRKVFTSDRIKFLRVFISNAFPKICRFFRFKRTPVDIETFFMRIVRETVLFRKEADVKRNDFMDLLITLLNKNSSDGITMNELSAQAFVFFLAGFETSSTAMTFAMHELALNPDIQQKARKQINDVLANHNGDFTYEAMMEMTYIKQIINESLRKYPPVIALNRVANANYKVPNTNFTIEKGVRVMIPLHAIQHDPEYYPNPDVYDPDRFTPDKEQKRNNATFLPFGDGPRNCIGLRFGMMQAQVGLVTLLKNYQFSLCEKSVVPLKISKTSFIYSSEGGVYVKFKSI